MPYPNDAPTGTSDSGLPYRSSTTELQILVCTNWQLKELKFVTLFSDGKGILVVHYRFILKGLIGEKAFLKERLRGYVC